MKSKVERNLWIVSVAMAGSLTMVGCGSKDSSEPTGPAERTGAAVDRATEKTVDTANTVADKTADTAKASMSATKDFADAAVEETGEGLEKVGTAVEKAGADMQD